MNSGHSKESNENICFECAADLRLDAVEGVLMSAADALQKLNRPDMADLLRQLVVLDGAHRCVG